MKNNNISSKNEINNNNIDKPNNNIIIERKKTKSKSHISISCKANNCRNNIRHKSNNILPLSIFKTNINEVEEKKVTSDKNLILETNIYNNKFLKPIDNLNSTQKNKFRISKGKKFLQRAKYIISENSNNNQLDDKKEIFTLKNQSKKDVSNFKSYKYFNNDLNSRRFFKSSDKLVKNHLAINSKMITLEN